MSIAITHTHCPNCGAALVELPPTTADPEIDEQRHKVNGVRLTISEWELFQLFRRHPGRLVTRENAIMALYGETRDEPEYADNLIKIYVYHLRKKFEYAHSHWTFETVWGQGYIAQRQG